MPDINISDLDQTNLAKPGVPFKEKRGQLGIITPLADTTATVTDGAF
jgi:hypothetical protein